jgi:hypothetical protein
MLTQPLGAACSCDRLISELQVMGYLVSREKAAC